MKRNIILTILILILCGLITCITILIVDNDVLYSLWCIAALVFGIFIIPKLKDWSNYLSNF